MSKITDAIRIAYPDSMRFHEPTDPPFKRPGWTGDPTEYTTGWYWTNVDDDRFYYDTYEEAAEDFAFEIDFDEEEAENVLTAGKAVT